MDALPPRKLKAGHMPSAATPLELDARPIMFCFRQRSCRAESRRRKNLVWHRRAVCGHASRCRANKYAERDVPIINDKNRLTHESLHQKEPNQFTNSEVDDGNSQSQINTTLQRIGHLVIEKSPEEAYTTPSTAGSHLAPLGTKRRRHFKLSHAVRILPAKTTQSSNIPHVGFRRRSVSGAGVDSGKSSPAERVTKKGNTFIPDCCLLTCLGGVRRRCERCVDGASGWRGDCTLPVLCRALPRQPLFEVGRGRRAGR